MWSSHRHRGSVFLTFLLLLPAHPTLHLDAAAPWCQAPSRHSRVIIRTLVTPRAVWRERQPLTNGTAGQDLKLIPVPLGRKEVSLLQILQPGPGHKQQLPGCRKGKNRIIVLGEGKACDPSDGCWVYMGSVSKGYRITKL